MNCSTVPRFMCLKYSEANGCCVAGAWIPTITSLYGSRRPYKIIYMQRPALSIKSTLGTLYDEM